MKIEFRAVLEKAEYKDFERHCELCGVTSRKGHLSEDDLFICDDCIEIAANAMCATRKEIKETGTFGLELERIIHNVQMSQICLADEIHDLRKTDDPSVAWKELKYEFWERAEGVLRQTRKELMEEYEAVESKRKEIEES